ncbi:MAG TPA: hypothetical protein V6C65_21720, partial [Allocoleopsis sp.]
PTPQGWLWSQQLNLYLGIHNNQLRFLTPEGQWLPLPEEEIQFQLEQERLRAEQERLRAEQERLRAEQAETELARLRALLASQGTNLDNTNLDNTNLDNTNLDNTEGANSSPANQLEGEG